MIKTKHKGMKVSASVYRDALRDGLKAVALYLRQEVFPVRFTKRGATMLGYTPRSGEPGSGRAFRGSYTWKKLKRYENGDGVRAIGETKPFVWSGAARRQSRSARLEARSPGAGKGHAKATFGPTQMNRKPKLLEEFQGLAAQEFARAEKILARWMDRSLDRRLARR